MDMAINISSLNGIEIIPEMVTRPETAQMFKHDAAEIRDKFVHAKENGQIADLLEISGVSQEQLNAMASETGPKRTGASYSVDAFFRKELPQLKNGDGSYMISGVKFSEDELVRARNVMKESVADLQYKVTLDYSDYAKMSIAESAVNSFAKDNFSEEQQNVIARAMKEYNAGLEERQSKSLSKANVVDNNYGELSEYYGKSQVIDQTLADEMNKLKDEIAKLTGHQFTKTVAGKAPGIITSATNRELINIIKDTFNDVDLNDKEEVDSAMKKYRDYMRPAYKVGGYIERDDSALYRDTDSFAKMINTLKQSMSSTHVDFSM